MTADVSYQRTLLESCASAFVASTDGALDQPISEEQGDLYLRCKSELEAAALAYAAAMGVPGAAEVAELETLRRLYNGIVSLRAELRMSMEDRASLTLDTIDALIVMSFPQKLEPR